MARIFYLHWNKSEASAHVRELRSAGHKVTFHFQSGTAPKIPKLPDAYVISLERLPSHGRAVAQWCHESKARRAIPLIFVGGLPEKIESIRREFPAATFCTRGELPSIIRDTPRAKPTARKTKVAAKGNRGTASKSPRKSRARSTK